VLNKNIYRCLAVFVFCVFAFYKCGANTPGTHTVLLTWTASSNAITYNVYRKTTTGVCNGTPTPYATLVNGTSFTDNTPPVGNVFYAVSGVNSTGESVCSSEGSAVVPAITTQPPTLIIVNIQ
jgi:hypothetical protein